MCCWGAKGHLRMTFYRQVTFSTLLAFFFLSFSFPFCGRAQVIRPFSGGATPSIIRKARAPRPVPVDCRVGETKVLVDNIGRVQDGVGPFLADPLPTSSTPAYLSMTNAYLQSAHQTYMAVSVMKAEHTAELSFFEVVLAQIGPSGAGNANPFDLGQTPANFAIHIYENYEELTETRIHPTYRACFNTPSELYNINLENPAPFNLRASGHPNYLLGFNLEERVTNIAAHIDVSACADLNNTFVLEGGKEYLIAIYMYADWIEDGYFGVVASELSQQSLYSYDGYYDPTFPDADSTHRIVDPTPTLAYMAMGEVVECCIGPEDCPCKYPPEPDSPLYDEWISSCTAGDPDDWGVFGK